MLIGVVIPVMLIVVNLAERRAWIRACRSEVSPSTERIQPSSFVDQATIDPRTDISQCEMRKCARRGYDSPST
jgi:hypothetical protein